VSTSSSWTLVSAGWIQAVGSLISTRCHTLHFQPQLSSAPSISRREPWLLQAPALCCTLRGKVSNCCMRQPTMVSMLFVPSKAHGQTCPQYNGIEKWQSP
jgi:hypothetical protein